MPLQLANYHILKDACNLPTNNRPATKVIIRPPPSILCCIFFFFLFIYLVFLSFPFLSLTPYLFSPRNCLKPTPDAFKSKVDGIKGISKPHPVRVLKLHARWYDILLSLSLSSLAFLFSSSSYPLTRPAHTDRHIRSSDQVTLAVAANNPITCKKDDPFDTMRLLCCADAVESRLTPAQNPAFKQRLLLLHTGKVQTRGRERRECKKEKEKGEGDEGEENERLNYDSRTSNIRRKMKVSLRGWCHWKSASWSR